MRYEDASGSISSQDSGVTDARDDADALSAGSRGPATGNTITGEGTITGAAGADIVDNGPGKIVALEGASGSDTAEGGSLHVEGRFGEITMDSRGGYSYTPHAAKPEGGSDVFRYTLADADGSRDTATLTIDIGREIEKIDANAQQLIPGPDGVITLPPGVELSDIMVVGRNLVINLPDGTQMVIIDGAVFVPQLVLNGVEVPATNLASLLIDAEPQPAAGTPLSSGGNFAVDVPPLDPGVPLGDLIPPTELVFEPPIFEDIGQFEDDEPEIFVQPDGQPASVAAVDSVSEVGLPTRNGGEPAGSGESADGNSSDNDDTSETTSGDILIDADDDPAVVSINGTAITSIGQVIAGAHGNLTITSISDTVIGYTYTLTDNTSGNDTHDDFIVTVEDNDGDTATATLTIDIIDDVPTARPDTDAIAAGQYGPVTGNVITDASAGDAGDSDAGADTVGADNASITLVSSANVPANSDSSGPFVVNGQYGVLTLQTDGSYSYVRNAGTPGGVNDVFNYTLTDGDGDTSTTTLTISIADATPSTGQNPNVLLDDDALAGGNPGGVGDDADAANTSGNLAGSGGDGPITFGLQTTGAPAGFTYVSGGAGVLLVQQGGTTVLTVTVNPATGAYTVVQNAPIDHPAGGDENNLDFPISYTVTDVDGDTATGTLNINVDDDTPTITRQDVSAPTLTVDETDLSTNASGNFSNLFAVSYGADGPGTTSYAVTVVNGTDSGLDDVATGQDILLFNNAGVVEGRVGGEAGPVAFTVSVNSTTGVVTLDQIRALEHPDATNPDDPISPAATSIQLTVSAVDGDGDPVSQTINIGGNLVFEDDGPTVTAALLVGIVDEDGVPGGIAGGVGDVAGESTVATGSVASLFNSGADAPLTFSLLANTSGLPALTSAGVPVTYSVVGNTLTASAGGNTVFTFVLNADGSYTFTLVDQLDHPAGNNENDLSIALGSIIQATDADGDSVTAPANGLVITVDDDTPTASATLLTGTVDEDGVPAGIPGGVGDVAGENTVAMGSVAALFNSGADQPLTYSLLANTSGLPALTSAGVPVTYSVVGNTLTASAGGNTVFTFVLNADGSYTFTLVDQLDHPAGNDENDLAISLGSIIQATDRDGDSVTANANGLVITVDDDTPQNNATTAALLVDEDALPGGNPGGPADGPGVLAVASTSVSALFSSGADQPLTISMSTNTSGLPALTSAGVPVTYSVVGNTLTASAGGNTVFTLVFDPATGNATFTLLDQLDHPTQNGTPDDNTENNLILDVSSVFVGTDADGDSVTLDAGSLTVDVDDDTPTIVARVELTGTVDEDGLAGGNPGGVNDVAGENVDVAGNVSALFSPGADQPLTYSLLTDTSGLPALTSNGVPVTYSVVGNTLTASAGGNTVFTFTLNATTGAYTFTLLDQLDHPSLDDLPGDDTENPPGTDIAIALGSIIQATDFDGDSVTAPANGLVITVDDDSPEEFEECPDDVIAINNPGSTFTGDLNLPPVGADQPGTVSFLVEDGDPVLDNADQPVTSEGVPLFYFINSEGVLEARAGDETGDVIFTVTINGDGTFTYDQIGPLGEGGGTSFNDLTSTSGGNAEFRGIGADDPATTVDVLLSAEAAGADATVNTDSDSIGSANQSMDVGETVRIDFVSDLTTGGGTPSGFSYSGHISSNSFIEVIPQVQGSQDETVAFTVWALDTTNTAAAEPDRNPAGGFSDSTITPVTEVTVRDYLTGNSTTADVTGFTTGVFTAVAYGISVRVNADGSVTFAGVQQGDSYGIGTGTGDFNAIAVQSDPAGTGGSTEDSFDLGIFSIGTETVVEPIDFTIPIALTDADGDSVVCDIDLVLGPPVDAPDITVTVNEAGLPVIGSNEASNLETQSGDLQTLVTGGTGPYTFTLMESGDGAFGTLVLNSNGTFTYTLDTPVDSQPGANDGTNPELAAEEFTFEAEDADGNVQTGTITVNIIDDVPSIDVTAGAETGVLVETQDADTIGVATDTASSSANFGGVFAQTFVAGADGAVATPVLAYTLGISAPAVDSGLDQGGANIYLHLIGGKVVGSTSSVLGSVNAANTVFDVSVNSSGVVTLTQYSQIDHPVEGTTTTPFADQNIGMTDSLVTLTASSSITDNDGDSDSDSATINIGNNLRFADHGPVATNDVDAIAAGFFGTATGNVMTGVDIAVGADANSSDGTADTVGADVPGRISQVSFTSDGGGAPVVQAIAPGGSTVINGDYGVLTLYSNGDYSYDRNEGSAGGVNDVFTYTLRDFDGDTATATLTINIAVNPPVATTASAAVDDDGLANANAAGANDINANTQPNPDDLDGAGSSEATFRGQLGVTGGDGDIDFSLIAPAGQVAVGQEMVTFSFIAGVLTATIATSPDATRVGDPLFTVQLDGETGEYIVTLSDNILHGDDANNDEDGTEVSVNIPYQVVDASLNTSAANGTLNIVFNDDVPTATNDVASQTTENAAFTIDALANDVFGADGVNIGSGSSVFVSTQATQGVVTYSTATNLFTYTPNAGAGSTSTADSFQYTIIDADGDVSVATVNVTLQPDSTPNAADGVAAVDDDALAGGNPASVTGDLDANAGEAAPVNSSEAVFHGQLAATSGNDTIVSYTFASMHATSGTVGTETVNYTWNAGTSTLTATVAAGARTGTVLFDVVVNQSTGEYNLTLRDNVLHAAGSNENDATTSLTFTVTDSDGDPDTGTIVVTFDDDAPTTYEPQNASVTNAPGAAIPFDLDDPLQSGDDDIGNNFGADGPGVVRFPSSIDDTDSGMTSGGTKIWYILDATGTILQGRTGADAAAAASGTLIFTITLDQANDRYTVDMDGRVDAFTQINFNDGTYDFVGGNDAWAGFVPNNQVEGASGDVPLNDDSDDLLLTPIGTGTSVNGNANSAGTGGPIAGQNIGQGEGMRLDFVEDLTGVGTPGDYGDPGTVTHDFDGHYDINGAVLRFGDGTSTQTTASFKAYTVTPLVIDDNGDDGTPDIVAGTGDLVSVTSVAIIYDGETQIVAFDPLDLDNTQTVTVGNPGGLADRTYTVEFVQDGGSGEWYAEVTGIYDINVRIATFAETNYNALEVLHLGPSDASADFAITGFGAAVQSTDPVLFSVPTEIVDGDGDVVAGGDIDVTLNPPAMESLVTKTSSSSITDSSDTSSLSLMNTDSIDNHRTMSAANNNSVLLGAIAAAGLGVSSAAAAHGFAQASGHQVLDTSSLHQNAASAAGFGMEQRESARDGLGGETQQDLRGNDNASGSTVQREFVDKGSLTNDSGDQAQAPSALSQGTELQASDAAQSNLTSAAVGMPSAEMLAGGNDNAVEGQAQGTAEVGRVLLDALAGGGRGPDIDAVIDAVANQGGGRSEAALEALASHAGLDVSAWHMAGSGGFSGGHAGAMEPMLHHDAVIVAS